MVIVDGQRLDLGKFQSFLDHAIKFAVDDQKFDFGMVELKYDDRCI